MTPPETLLTYEDLRAILGGTRPLSLRQVKRIVKAHRGVALPIEYGHRTVRFRPANIEKLKSRLSGEPVIGMQL